MKVISSGKGPMLQPPDLNQFREHNRTKPRGLIDKRMTEAEAVSQFIHDGDYIGTELYGTVRCPQSLINEVVRQGKRYLRVAGQGVYELDMLLGASLVKALDHTYIGMEVYGISNCLRREVESGRVEHCVEWSNAGIAWRFKAAAMGVPFIPVRSMLGTDTLEYSAAKVVEDPFTGDPIALLPALILDVGMIHVHRTDKYGNAQIDGISGFAFELARASKRLLISTEQIVPEEEIRRHPEDLDGTRGGDAFCLGRLLGNGVAGGRNAGGRLLDGPLPGDPEGVGGSHGPQPLPFHGRHGPSRGAGFLERSQQFCPPAHRDLRGGSPLRSAQRTPVGGRVARRRLGRRPAPGAP